MKEFHAVTCFLLHNDKVLVLKRSDKVGSYQRKWGAVTGYVEEYDKDLTERAVTEIMEETGIKDAELECAGEPLRIEDTELDTAWIVHPFLFTINSPEVILDWEHTEYRWIYPEEMKSLDAVPKLYNNFLAIMQKNKE